MTTALELAYKRAGRAPDSPETIEYKVAGPGVSGILDGSEDGVVCALVSVTGVPDEVNDIIIPGAYKGSLEVRTPKGVWSHDWDVWVSRTEDIKELLPGDPMLPALDRKGNPWPTEAGALWVKTRFNLGTTAGKDAYSNVLFFGDEVEWSVGYNVPAGKSRKAQGYRLISYMDTFEYGPVLFGAAPLSGTVALEERKRRELKLEGIDVAKLLEGKDLAEDLDLEHKGKADAGVDTHPAGAARLAEYWEHGEGGAKIKWGTDGDFMRCVDLVVEHAHMTPEKAKGYCALRHRGATGGWPGHAPAEEAEKATKKGSKSMGTETETKDSAVPIDGKMFGVMPGSNEALAQALNSALSDALLPEPTVNDNGYASRNAYLSIDATFPAGDATHDGPYVVCTVTDWSQEPSDRQTWEVPFTVTGDLDGDDDDVTLGAPQPMQIVVSLAPDDDYGKDTGDPGVQAVVTGAQSAMKALETLIEVKAAAAGTCKFCDKKATKFITATAEGKKGCKTCDAHEGMGKKIAGTGAEVSDIGKEAKTGEDGELETKGAAALEAAKEGEGTEGDVPLKPSMAAHLVRKLKLAHSHLGSALAAIGVSPVPVTIGAGEAKTEGTKTLEGTTDDDLEELLLRQRALKLTVPSS